MRILAEMIESALHDASPATRANQFGFSCLFWNTPNDVSNAYEHLATAIVDAVKLIQQINKSPR